MPRESSVSSGDLGLGPRAVLLVLAYGCGLAACGGSSQSDTNVSLPLSSGFEASRPATVPADFIATPNGWFHPSCIIEVSEDDEVLELAIHHKNGTRHDIARCEHPHFDRKGNAIFPEEFDPTVNSWVARASAVTQPVAWLSATWTVPPNPASNSGQTLYFFPGLELSTLGDTILQPVLAWNGAHAPAGWAIYSWNCCRNGNEIYSTPASVGAGETISGYASGTNCNTSTGVCNNWQIRASSTNSSSTLNTDSYGEKLDWVFGGVTEVYNVTACNQYPPNLSVGFQNIIANQVGGGALTPAWVGYLVPNLSPNCATGVQTSANSVTIQWCIPLTCQVGRCGTVADGCGGMLSCGSCPAGQHCVSNACVPNGCPPPCNAPSGL